MSEQDKYQDFTATTITELWKKTDRYVKKGYEILITLPLEKNEWGERFFRSMGLKGKDYSDVVRVADAPQDEANMLLALGTGWEIASTSVSSKFYRMVKRGEDTLRQELRDWLDKDGELDSIISIIEDHVP